MIFWLSSVLQQLAEHWVEAVITFSATFAGVLLAFRLENRRSTNQEKDDFGKVLQSLVSEGALNLAQLNKIKDCGVYKIPMYSLSNQLALAIGSPLFHRWAKHSLVLAATITSAHIEAVNNSLARLRAGQEEISEQSIEELKAAAKKGQELIRVMHDLINDDLKEFGGRPRPDAKTKETGEKLKSIMSSEVK